MRIGINASFLRKPNTGIAQVSWNFLQELTQREKDRPTPETEFFVYLEEAVKWDWPKNFHPVVLRTWWRRDDLIRKICWEKCRLPRRARRDGCQAFFSLYQCPSVFSYRIKHIMLVHDIIPKFFPGYLNNFRKKIYWRLTERGIKRCGKILAVSHHTEKDLVRYLHINPRKITVVYPDCGREFSRKVSEKQINQVLEKYQLSRPYLLAGGVLEQRKNIEKLILAYQRLVKKGFRENPAALPPLAIVGKLMPQLAPLVTDAEKIVAQYNLTERVKLLNFVPQEDLPALYQGSLGFVYPSLYEGFGLPVLEAMRSGTPVITSKVSSLPEVGGDGVLYANVEDPEDLAMVMKNLINNHDLRQQVAARGQVRACRFSIDQLVEKFSHLTYGRN